MADAAMQKAFLQGGGERDPITAQEIKRAVRKYLERERNGKSLAWAVFEELRLGSGFQHYPSYKHGETFEDTSRIGTTIDVFAICTWPSRNFLRRAYEIKVSRSDLLSELANPDKRAPWFDYVNEFYFVVPTGLCSRTEIEARAPECGLVVYGRPPKRQPGNWRQTDRSGLRIVKPALRGDSGPPTWRLLASILRAASKDAA